MADMRHCPFVQIHRHSTESAPAADRTPCDEQPVRAHCDKHLVCRAVGGGGPWRGAVGGMCVGSLWLPLSSALRNKVYVLKVNAGEMEYM